MKKHIPNIFTCLNIATGTFAIAVLIYSIPFLYHPGEEQRNIPHVIWILPLLCLIFDFADGLAARILNAKSEMGKQLDSLADLVSFAIYPTVLLIVLIFFDDFDGTIKGFRLPIFVIPLLLIPICSALRLAKFNVAESSEHFKGLPTPANAIFLIGIFYISFKDTFGLTEIRDDLGLVFVWLTVIISSLLLVSKINLFSFKFSHFKWKGNEMRYLFIIMVIILAVWLKFAALAPIIVVYIIWSIISNKIWKWSLPQK